MTGGGHGGHDEAAHGGAHGGHHEQGLPDRLSRAEIKRMGLRVNDYDSECSGLIKLYVDCWKKPGFNWKSKCDHEASAYNACVNQLFMKNLAAKKLEKQG
jgi:hypothetical protein